MLRFFACFMGSWAIAFGACAADAGRDQGQYAALDVEIVSGTMHFVRDGSDPYGCPLFRLRLHDGSLSYALFYQGLDAHFVMTRRNSRCALGRRQ